MIVLYNPRSSAGRKPILPLSLLAIAALLERDWVLVDGNLDAPVARADALFRQRPQGTPAILAVTVMPGPQLEEALPVTRALKRLHPELTVVWGGYFPSQHWETVLSDPDVDYVVRKHGERTFAALVEAIWRGTDPGDLPGLAWNADGHAVTGPDPDLPHPRDLPPLPLTAVDLERYVRPTFLGDRTLGYHSSYGCPYTCNFCAVVNLVNGRWLPQPAQQVVDAVRLYVDEHDVDAVEFYDNNFFVHEKRTVSFANGVRDLGIRWWGEGRVDTLLRYSDASWEAMADSGLSMVFLGAESGSAETLARMNKGGTLTPEMTLDLVERMDRYGVVPELSFVLGNPPDPERDVEETLAFVRQVKARNPRTEIILYLYTPVPLDGELSDAAAAAGFRYPDTLDEWVGGAWLDTVQRRSDLPWVSPEIRDRLRGFERVLNAYYPTSTDRRLGRLGRAALRGLASWRWHNEIYRRPLELEVLQKVLRYQRPETSGF